MRVNLINKICLKIKIVTENLTKKRFEDFNYVKKIAVLPNAQKLLNKLLKTLRLISLYFLLGFRVVYFIKKSLINRWFGFDEFLQRVYWRSRGNLVEKQQEYFVKPLILLQVLANHIRNLALAHLHYKTI